MDDVPDVIVGGRGKIGRSRPSPRYIIPPPKRPEPVPEEVAAPELIIEDEMKTKEIPVIFVVMMIVIIFAFFSFFIYSSLNSNFIKNLSYTTNIESISYNDKNQTILTLGDGIMYNAGKCSFDEDIKSIEIDMYKSIYTNSVDIVMSNESRSKILELCK